MYEQLTTDAALLPSLLARLARHTTTYLASLPDSEVASQTASPPAASPGLDLGGCGSEEALHRFLTQTAPYLPASSGPRYLGFVQGGVTPAALVGDWLAATYDQNPISDLDARAALKLESSTLGMLAELVGLPPQFAGTFLSGATMSNFHGLAQARQWCGHQGGLDVAADGFSGAARPPILSGSPHSSTGKALAMLGWGRGALHLVGCLPGREAVDVDRLRTVLAQRREAETGPCVVVANAGTVNTGDFDDISALAELREEFGFWLHVDAAFGGFAGVTPESAKLLAGWHRADSICLDLHKWLNVPYDAAVAFSRHQHLALEVFANDASYLGQSEPGSSPVQLAPENSHRWRALPAWFTLTAYGRDGYREIVARNCSMARALGDKIAASDQFELLAPVRLNVVCFTLQGGARPLDAATIDRFIAAVRSDGGTFVTPTVLAGRPAVRAAFCNWRTTESDLGNIWLTLRSCADQLDRG